MYYLGTWTLRAEIKEVKSFDKLLSGAQREAFFALSDGYSGEMDEALLCLAHYFNLTEKKPRPKPLTTKEMPSDLTCGSQL